MDIGQQLQDIEQALENGTYQPGPWKSLLKELRALPQAERASYTEAVNRVSDRLHLRQPRRTLPFGLALVTELVLAILGLAATELAARHASVPLALVAATLCAVSFQPLVKIFVGTLMGIQYSYAYLLGPEPRFKMRYGTYVQAHRTHRVLFHLSGSVGTPLGLWWVGHRTAPVLPGLAQSLQVLAWLCLASAVLLALAAITHTKRVLGIPVAASSVGAAVEELLSER